ncbi:CCA tRNA nucleotidyltransferase [Candidatus Pacearchaeota archaeon]|nr:CCA tRNA nucleotidyltransferase [Candidatus Pacearchaeota archaeon]
MKAAVEIIKTLNSNGYEGYVVGGWVRDMILGIPSADIDIATNATPEQVAQLFKKVIPTGIDHGTVTVLYDGAAYEITTYRHDITTDGRNATIKFADTIEEDLSRRDFTMNAIAYNPITDEYVDPFNGVKDIKRKHIKCVGDSDTRFKEDHLRMLRAIRFYASLGKDWSIDTKTYHAIKDNAALINKISKERIKAEIDKCFTKADRADKMFYKMKECGLLKHILPELEECFGFDQHKYHKWDVFVHTLEVLGAVPKEYPLIRWAALFHDLGKPASCENYGTDDMSFHKHELISKGIAISIMKRLRFSGDDKRYIANLVKCHMFQCSKTLTDGAIRRFIVKLGVEYIDDICILKWADRCGNPLKKSGPLDIANTNLKKRALKILEEDAAFKITDLSINGKDIMSLLNIPAGPAIGKILKALLEEVLDSPSLNTKEILSDMIVKQRVKE